jgi:hypothetical protein
MSESYVSSRNGDLSPSVNGTAPNGSSPSLPASAPSVTPIIRKKLMGYVGFANLPNQVHRKSVRKGFQFTVMVVGMSPRPLRWPFPSTDPRQASRVWASRPWSTHSSILLSIPTTNPLHLILTGLRPLPSKASAPVMISVSHYSCWTYPEHFFFPPQISRKTVFVYASQSLTAPVLVTSSTMTTGMSLCSPNHSSGFHKAYSILAGNLSSRTSSLDLTRT